MGCECEGCGSLDLPQGPQGEQGEPGVNGTNGTNGVDGSDGISIAYIVTPATDFQCPCGGTQIQLGPDADGDGIPSPITNTLIICSGCDATAPFDGGGGGIIMYDGDITNPALFVQSPSLTAGLGLGAMLGWALCNGNNNTPDMRGSFPLCTGQNQNPAINTLGLTYALGDTGGIDEYILTASELAAHNHTAGTLATGPESGHTHTVTHNFAVISNGSDFVAPVFPPDGAPSGSVVSSTGSGHTHPITNSTANNTPAGQAHENRPMYYSVNFIKRIL